MQIFRISRILWTLLLTNTSLQAAVGQFLGNTTLRRRLGSVLLLTLASGCGLQKDIDVALPAGPAQLVVECYLENGRVPRMTVSETVPYLSTTQASVPTDATAVIIQPNGRRDTLRYAPGLDRITGKAFTHIGQRPISAPAGATLGLEVADKQGRRVTGTAVAPTLVPIDSVEWKFDDKPLDNRRAYVLLRYQDPATPNDYYRFQIHKGSISSKPEIDYSVEDRLFNGQKSTLGTSYRFVDNDTLQVSLYHLDQGYYQFLQSIDNARNANGNPFAQPAAIQSTVQGGVGIFTVLSYQRRQVILK